MQLSRCLLASLASVALSLCARADYSWDFTSATASAGAATVNDTTGSAALVFATGAASSADGLALDGSQKDPGQTARAVETFPSVEITLKLKPAGTGPDRQTVVGFGNAYEIRYTTKGVLEFIVFYPDKKFTIAQVKAPAGQWHNVKATFKDGKLALTVGQTTKEAVLPAGAAPDSKGTRIRVGRQGERAFVGTIAALSIKAP